MSDASSRPVIFISYAHADEPSAPAVGEVKWLSFVQRFLQPAVKDGVFDVWVDRQMKGGADWDPEIETKLRACDIFILLVSAFSMASDYIIDNEIAIIRERQARGEPVHFYPLLLTPTPSVGGLNKVRDKNLRPRDAVPLSGHSAYHRAWHMADMADEIAKIAEDIAKWKRAAQTATATAATASIPYTESRPIQERLPGPDVRQQRAQRPATQRGQSSLRADPRQKKTGERDSAARKETDVWKVKSRRIIVWGGAAASLLALMLGTVVIYQPTLDGYRSPDAQSPLDVQRPLAILQGHTGSVFSAVFSPDGRGILTGSGDGTARLWNGDGKWIATLTEHTGPVARLWNGARLEIFQAGIGRRQRAVFSPDGHRILTQSDTVRLWDSNGQPLGTLPQASGGAFEVAFSPDGRRILTPSADDKEPLLWDSNGKLLAILRGHTGQVNSAVFSPDGTVILTASEDNTARLWDARQ